MFVIVAELRIKSDQLTAFLDLIKKQAETSVEHEDGCHQFDVCQAEENPNEVVLYEVYSDASAFEEHTQTDRFASFFQNVGPMLESEPVLRRFARTFANLA